MGFDPRTWARRPEQGRQVTCNLEGLLAENAALRREITLLRQEIAALRHDRSHPGGPGSRPSVTTGAGGSLTPELVRRWALRLAGHPRWAELHLGVSGAAEGSPRPTGLRGLIRERLSAWGDPGASLEAALERRWPGLGRELRHALAGPSSRAKLAVQAAFALYGARAPERLDADPLGVVEDLLAGVERLEAAGRQARAAEAARERSRREKTAKEAGSAPSMEEEGRTEALRTLGLQRGASQEAVKAAHRRLVKRHHPDLGGDPATFRRVDGAYRLLLAWEHRRKGVNAQP